MKAIRRVVRVSHLYPKPGCSKECCPPDVWPVPDVYDHQLPWEMVHYDVQFIGGIALHEKRIAEMATGEARPLSRHAHFTSTLTGRNCQLVTVNDYLASGRMGHLFRFLADCWLYPELDGPAVTP